MLRKTLFACAVASALAVAPVFADNYVIDTKDAHAFIQFRIQHLGYSWLYGRFNEFSGNFSYDEKKTAEAKVEVSIKTASIDTNHAARDKHLLSADFLDAEQYPDANFVSHSFTDNGDGTAVLSGDFTFHGVTKPLRIDVTHIGAGPDPWGGYRRGFTGTSQFALKDFGINYDLGPAAQQVELILSVEGIRQ